MDTMSGMTSQPCLGSIVEALRHSERDTGLDPAAIRQISFYWEAVRTQYAAFESDLKSGVSEVYLHEMPGGQFTNLKEQARALGLETRWHEVAKAYRDANDLFGDIVKVTPSSKVVGDMALMMVAQDLTAGGRAATRQREIAFPESVVEMLRGELGQPPAVGRAGAAEESAEGRERRSRCGRARCCRRPISTPRREAAEKAIATAIDDHELASYLMYPKVFTEFAAQREVRPGRQALPTPVFFYGMAAGDEIADRDRARQDAGRAPADDRRAPTRRARSASSSS